jgi:hypothetical protein
MKLFKIGDKCKCKLKDGTIEKFEIISIEKEQEKYIAIKEETKEKIACYFNCTIAKQNIFEIFWKKLIRKINKRK